jgi:hypothetical protein
VTVKRRRYGSTGHGYAIDGDKIPGVTTILKVVPNDALIGWAAKATAEYALDHWDELTAMLPSVKLKTLTGARYETRDAAAKRGTEIHKLGEGLVAGQPVSVPEEIAGHIDAYRAWLDAVEPVPVATELVVASREHRYCGTSDLIADLPDILVDDETIPACRWLLELKSTASGVWPESALQACAYSRAEMYVHPEHPDDEQPMDLLGIERCGVVWIKSDTCELRPVDTGDEVWEFFLHLRWLYDHMEIRNYKPVLPGHWVGPAASVDLALAAS